MSKSDVFWVAVATLSVPVGVLVGIIISEIKDFLDDNILHKDFDVEKFIEENTVDWNGGYKSINLGKAKLWQVKRVLKYNADNINKRKNETSKDR